MRLVKARAESGSSDFVVHLLTAQNPGFALPAIRLGRIARRLRYGDSGLADGFTQGETGERPGDTLSHELVRALEGLRADKPVRSVGALVLQRGTGPEHAVAYALASELRSPASDDPGAQRGDTYVVLQAVCVHPKYMANWDQSRAGAGLSALAATCVLSQFPPDAQLRDDVNAMRVLLHEGFETGGVLGPGVMHHRHDIDDTIPEDPQRFVRHASPLKEPLELPRGATVQDAQDAISMTFPGLPTFETYSTLSGS